LGLSIAPILLVIYSANGTFLTAADTEVNARSAWNLVEHQSFLMTPRSSPDYYHWKVAGPKGTHDVRVTYFDQRIEELVQKQQLYVEQESYLVRASRWPGYAFNTFGFGVSTTSAPIMACLDPWLSDPETKYAWLWKGGKIAASLFVAGSAVWVYLTLVRYLHPVSAWCLTLAYGLGTSVWSISSQALWPHGPSEFFLAMGTYALVRSKDHGSWGAWCGFAFACATCCRQPSAMAVLAAGLYFLFVDRRALILFVLAGLPLALAMFGFNAWCYGSPFHFGELLVPQLARETTGNDAMWQTPLHVGLAGLLMSPSRGLFVYSPFLVASLWGFVRIWKTRHWIELRPVTGAILAMWLVHSRYFDWWGGWSFGYRHIVDSTTLMVICLVPLANIALRPWSQWLFGGLLAWSIGVQAIGAWAFDIEGWNNRRAVVSPLGETVVVHRYLPSPILDSPTPPLLAGESIAELDIDRPENRHRLWSWTDNQILYYLQHWNQSILARQKWNAYVARGTHRREEETWESLRVGLRAVGLPEPKP
jgi:hypothetical protein